MNPINWVSCEKQFIPNGMPSRTATSALPTDTWSVFACYEVQLDLEKGDPSARRGDEVCTVIGPNCTVLLSKGRFAFGFTSLRVIRTWLLSSRCGLTVQWRWIWARVSMNKIKCLAVRTKQCELIVIAVSGQPAAACLCRCSFRRSTNISRSP